MGAAYCDVIDGAKEHTEKADRLRTKLAASFAPIGGSGLRGSMSGGFIAISGPCGEGHVMSRSAARDLINWLERKLAQ